MVRSKQRRAELLEELKKIDGFLALDDRRQRRNKPLDYYGALYLIAAAGYYVYGYGPYDNTCTLTPEEYRQAVEQINAGEVDWDDDPDTALLMVRENCKPGIVYIDGDSDSRYIDTTVNHEEGFLASLEFVEWKEVKTSELRGWLERVENIRRGYAFLK